MALTLQNREPCGLVGFASRLEPRVGTGRDDRASRQTGAGLEGLKEDGCSIDAGGNVAEFPRWEESPQVKQEPEEQLSQHWEVQWQEQLKTAESPHTGWGSPRVPEEPIPWDDAKAFLASFEQVAQACRWPREEWVARLLPALSGEAKQAFSRLEGRDREDYGKVKAAILRGDALSREKQRQHFRRFCYQEAEGPRGVYSQLQELCHQWLKVERHTKEQILETLILEQFLTILPPAMQSWVRANSPETCSRAVALAEDFLQGQREKEKQRQQMPGPFERQTAEFSAAKETQLATKVGPVFSEIKLEATVDANPLVCSEVMQNEQQSPLWKNVQKMEVHQITLGEAEQNLSQLWKEGETSVNECVLDRAQGNHPKVMSADEGLPREAAHGKLHEAPLHPASNKGKGKNVCADCGKSFKWNSRLVAHRRLHTGERPYKCSLCGKSFRRNAHLYQHHRIHTGEKPYKCPDCGKSFNDRSTFLKHRRTHTGDKPYKCFCCGKSFIQSSHLYRHQRTHVGESPFELTVGMASGGASHF